jgi:DNA primase
MSGLIPAEFISDLLSRSDLTALVSQRVRLKKVGANYQGLCPFHQEKTPSFVVSPSKQIYHCFGCGAHGDAIKFLQETNNLSFPEAVADLAAQAGLPVPNQRQSAGKQVNHQPLYQLLQQAVDCFQQQLYKAPDTALAYLKQRGVTDSAIKGFALGYAPAGWDNLLTRLGKDQQLVERLLSAGLVVQKADKQQCYDRFRQRLIFPIRDRRGRVIGFGGRVLGDEQPKYLNSPDTPVFDKSRVLYGLYEALQANQSMDKILVVEGYMDVIALAQQGITNVVATLGTATTHYHLEQLFQFSAELVFCFDGDQAGQKAAWRALQVALPLLQDGRQVRFLFLAEQDDPDSLIQKRGAQVFRQYINDALPLTDYLFNHLSKTLDLTDLAGRARLAKLATPLLEQLPKGVLKDLMYLQLAQMTGLADHQLTQKATSSEGAVTNTTNRPVPTQARESTSFSQVGTKDTLSPALKAVQVLLTKPTLANQLDLPLIINQSSQPHSQLLVSVVDFLRTRPNFAISQLLGYWHNTENGRLIKQLLEKEQLLPEQQLDHELAAALQSLQTLETNLQLQQLEVQVKANKLTKAQGVDWLKRLTETRRQAR